MSQATLNAQEIDFEACLRMEQEIDEMNRLLANDSWLERLVNAVRGIFRR